MPDKLHLAQLPTPIAPLTRLSAATGKNLYIKRDDMTGTEVSGNKVRKLEYALAEALRQGCDCVVTVGAVQSNHCRATAACCAALGLPCHLLLRGDEVPAEGNLFLDRLLGAHIHFLPADDDLGAAAQAQAGELLAQGKKPYLIPLGASNAVGSLGYVNCYREMLKQEEEMGLHFDAICLAVGSGGTYAGLWLENQRQPAPRRIRGYAVSNDSAWFVRAISHILTQMGAPPAQEAHIDIADDYVGLGYGQATREEIGRYADIAALEGFVLDPCYTGKAFTGMLEDIAQGVFEGERNILFLHTGGLLGWTAAQRALAEQYIKEKTP